MASVPKLKVYSTSIGFDDALIAAPSQKAALRAWGTTTDLFAAGRASIVDDPELQALALAKPGEVVRRPHGDARALIAAMDAENAAEQPRQKRPSRQLTSPPPPDRSELDAATRALADAEHDLRSRLDEFAAERTALDEREQSVRRQGEARIRELGRAKEKAEGAYRRKLTAAQRGR